MILEKNNMNKELKELGYQVSIEEITIIEAESKLKILYDIEKFKSYLIAKEWGFINYIQQACGIEQYAFHLFLKDFENWYETQYSK